MPMTLTDIAKLDDAGVAGIVQETAKSFPLIEMLPAVSYPSTITHIPVVTGLPSGEFRGEYAAHIESTGTIITRPVEMRYYDASWSLDSQVALRNANGVNAACAFAGQQAMLGAFRGIETACIYDAVGGFGGFKSLIPAAKTINAGGSTANTQSRVIAVNFSAVELAVGENGRFARSPVTPGLVPVGGGGYHAGYWQTIEFFCSLAVKDYSGVAQIVNLDATKTLDNDLLYDLIGSFRNGLRPDAIFMSHRSLTQLRKSRSADINAQLTFQGQSAPIPTDCSGVPIFALDTIVDTEAVTA